MTLTDIEWRCICLSEQEEYIDHASPRSWIEEVDFEGYAQQFHNISTKFLTNLILDSFH